MSDSVRAIKAKMIAKDNDLFRATLIKSPRHRFVITEGVAALSEILVEQVITHLREFNDFNEDNDPHGEHDFGKLEVLGEFFYFKIDYYDENYEYGADPYEEIVCRVLTLMRADEY